MNREESIEVVRKNWPDASFTQLREALETLIPELKESEDERMYARVTKRYTRIEKYYLRALGETEANKVLKECEEEELWIKNLLERQQEQKPAGWSEEYREEDLRTRFAFYTYKDEDGVLYLSNVFVEETSRNKGFGTKILQAAEKVAETIGAITIRLKVKQNSPANAWYRKHGYGYMTFEDGYDWLEKTLNI